MIINIIFGFLEIAVEMKLLLLFSCVMSNIKSSGLYVCNFCYTIGNLIVLILLLVRFNTTS